MPGQRHTNVNTTGEDGLYGIEGLPDHPEAGTPDYYKWLEYAKISDLSVSLRADYEHTKKNLQLLYDVDKKNLVKKISQLKKDINQERLRSIEIISLFVAFMTFVASEVVIIKNADPLFMGAFSMILLGGLLGFVMLVNIVSRSFILDEDFSGFNRVFWWLIPIILSLVFIASGWYLLTRSYETVPKNVQQQNNIGG